MRNELADIRELRVLIVGGRLANVQVLRTALGLAGLRHIIVIADTHDALELLRHERFAAIFCDAAVDRVEGMAFPLAVRRGRGVIDRTVPLFLVCPTAPQRLVEQARDSGVTHVLAHPITAATIAGKLAAAVTAPRRFIVASTFVGPDRRSGRLRPYQGRERRS